MTYERLTSHYSFWLPQVKAHWRRKSAFQDALDEGQFVFVLDGFDELRSDRRSNVEEWILNIGNSQNIILVSGRPDPAFEAWQAFPLHKMLPMTLRQTVSLVGKIDFDQSVKMKFIDELKRRLFNRHKTFASRPLLATMMLLTFNSYADMPEKIHVFYDQAFDTLFSRHDATKEAFKRERNTKYSIDVFKRYLSYFCLITYNENRTEFSESEILERIARVGAIENVTVEAENLLKDLLDCVCILQRDGLNIVFSHRSFQEYFTAYCLVRLSETRAAELIQRFAWRSADTVLSMMFDMNKDFVIRSYMFPTLSLYVEKTKSLTSESSLADHVAALGCGFMIKYLSYTGTANTILFYLFPFDHELAAVRLVAFSLYRSTFGPGNRNHYLSSPTYHPRKDYPAFRKLVLPTVKRLKGGKFFSLCILQDDGTIEFHDQSIETIHNLPDTALEACKSWLESAELRMIFWTEHSAILGLHKSMSLDQSKKTKSLDEILNANR